jgi:hypothetical protein
MDPQYDNTQYQYNGDHHYENILHNAEQHIVHRHILCHEAECHHR